MEPVINELLQHPDPDFILRTFAAVERAFLPVLFITSLRLYPEGLLFLKELMADDPYALFSHSAKMLDPVPS